MTYPTDVARLVTILRPDLGGVAEVLTVDPTLTAGEVIAILDEATEDARIERERDAR